MVAPVDSPGEERYAGSEASDNEVKLGKPFKNAGVGKPCRRKHDIEFKAKDDRNPPILHDLRANRGGRVNKYRHAQRLRPLIDWKEKVGIRGLTRNIGKHADPFEPEIKDGPFELLQGELDIDQRKHCQALKMVGVLLHDLGEAVVDNPAHLGALTGRKPVDTGVRGRQDLHVYVVLLDLIQPHFNVEEVLGHRAGSGPHAQNDFLSLFVLFNPHVSFGGFEFLQVFLRVEMAMKINVHDYLPLDTYGTLVTNNIKCRQRYGARKARLDIPSR